MGVLRACGLDPTARPAVSRQKSELIRYSITASSHIFTVSVHFCDPVVHGPDHSQTLAERDVENSQYSRPWDEFLWEVRRWFGIGLVYSASRLVFHLQKLVYDRDPGQEYLQTLIIKDLCLSCQTA